MYSPQTVADLISNVSIVIVVRVRCSGWQTGRSLSKNTRTDGSIRPALNTVCKESGIWDAKRPRDHASSGSGGGSSVETMDYSLGRGVVYHVRLT